MGKRVECRKTLEDPDGIIGAQDGDPGAQNDALGLHGNSGKNRLRCGNGEVIPVVLAQSDGVNSHFISKNGFIYDVADDLCIGKRNPARVMGDITKGVKA
jgi:hypothetical protein